MSIDARSYAAESLTNPGSGGSRGDQKSAQAFVDRLTGNHEVVETEPGLKSATASSVTKPAKTETGLVVQVPPFINEGEKIRVDTSEGAYMSRA